MYGYVAKYLLTKYVYSIDHFMSNIFQHGRQVTSYLEIHGVHIFGEKTSSKVGIHTKVEYLVFNYHMKWHRVVLFPNIWWPKLSLPSHYDANILERSLTTRTQNFELTIFHMLGKDLYLEALWETCSMKNVSSFLYKKHIIWSMSGFPAAAILPCHNGP